MLKSKWIASVLALALIVTPVQGVTAAEAVTGTEAVTDTEAATTSGGNAVTEGTQNTGDNSSDNSGATSAAEEKLDTPTELSWKCEYGKPTVQWKAVPSKTDKQVVYDIEVYREGDSEPSYQDYGIPTTSFAISEGLSEGNYQFRVRARYPENELAASDFSQLSQVYTVKKIAIPTGLKLETFYSKLYASWNPITDAPSVVYDTELYREGEKEPCKKEYGLYHNAWYIPVDGLADGKYRFRVMARQLNGEEINSDFSEYSEVFELKKLATPTAKWGEGWMPVLDDSQYKEQIAYFDVDIYKNGESIGQITDLWMNDKENNIDYSLINRVRFLSKFNDSGAYQITMKAVPTDNSTSYASNTSALSEVKNYVMPDNHLDVPTVKPHATLPGVFEISNLDGSIGCTTELYYDRGSNGAEWIQVERSTYTWNNADFQQIVYYDFRKQIDKNNIHYGLGQYRLQARAISGNIAEVANSDLSGLFDCEPSVISSLPLDMTPVEGSGNTPSKDPVISPAPTVTDKETDQIKESLKDIVLDNKNNTATAIVKDIKAMENKEQLGAVMQQDSSVATLMSSIEKDYLNDNDITVSKTIEPKVNTFMDPNAISVVGAGLNVTSGDVALNVSVPDKKIDLGKKYNNYNNLQFEIKLVSTELEEHGKLAVPVVITMPIPKGLTSDNLEIIHCKTDGTYERIVPKNNGDGTISFAVTEFSTFAFVNAVKEQPADTNSKSDTAADSGSSSGSGSVEVVYDVDWNNVQNTVAANQTGTTNITTGNSMQVSGQLLQTLKSKNGVLALHTGNGITVSISGKDLKKTDKNVAITFAENPNIPASAKSSVLANTLYSRSFETKEKVLYSVKMDIHFNVGKQYAGKYANLYHYDEQTGTMKLEGTYRITDTGAAMLLLYHGDEYVLTVTEKAPKGVVAGGVSNADYTVAEGDTLWGIAVKNGISLRKILAANPNIKNPDRIHVGQKIVIK